MGINVNSDLPVAVPGHGNKPRHYRPERFQLVMANYSKRNAEMQSFILKNTYIYQLVILIFLSIERQAKAVSTQSENGKFVIYQSTIRIYLFSLPMTLSQ
ncbi:hypothetical protein M8494_09585 [Serratia ureilytica]